MALNPSSMVQAFLAIATNPPKTPKEAAHRYAVAYDSYAKTAQALGSFPVFTGLEEQALEAILFAAMSLPVGLPITMATAWGLGVASYWNLPPVAFVGPQVGAVLQAATASAIIIPAMTTILLIPGNPALTAALGMATALDLGTRTVTCLLTPPPGTVAPLL
jgi:hypothetical protein